MIPINIIMQSIEKEILIEIQMNNNIKQEIKCIICLTLPPLIPFQCIGCDSIICKECLLKLDSKNNCPVYCSQQKYDRINPKTNLILESIMIECKTCKLIYDGLQYPIHEKRCENLNSVSEPTIRYELYWFFSSL